MRFMSIVTSAHSQPPTPELMEAMNKLADRVETVSPFLVDRILATDRSGTRIRWLTGGKIAGRMTMGLVRQRPDQFKDFGI